VKNRKGIVVHFAILAVIAIVALSFQQVAQAQRMRMKPEERAKALKDSLSLSDEQAAKVTKIYEAQQAEMREKMGELQGDRDAMRQAMQAMTAKTDSLIGAVLTKDQLKKYQELQKQMRQPMMQRQRNN
jgi:Spy/CpxP family protein refolding chaperone